MLISVIVPVRDDLEGLRILLEALAAQERPADEVLVVDSASSPPVPPLDEVFDGAPPTWRRLRVDEPGSYRARNAGLAAARGTVLAFTDADCRPLPDWLAVAEELFTGVDGPAAFGGHVEVTTRQRGRATPAEAYELLHAFQQHHYVVTRNFAATANLVVNRPAVDLVGPFDDSLASGGDLEWGTRAGTRGLRLGFAPEMVVEHPARTTIDALLAKRRRVLLGHADLSLRDGPRRPPLWKLLLVPVRTRWKVLSDDRHPLATRLKAVAVAQGLQWASIALRRHERDG